MSRSAERTQFLSDVLSTSLHYHWFRLIEADWDKGTATIKAEHDENYWQKHEIGPDDVARGLRMYREWLEGKREAYPGQWEMGFSSSRAEGERAGASYYGWELVKADRTNGEEGDYDADTADAALQFAIFGGVIYS